MKPGLLMLPSAVSDSRVHNILPNKIETDFQFSRASSATRVNHQGLIENVGYFSDELVQNGDFSELGSDVVINGDFSNGLNSWVTEGVELAQGGVRIESNGITGSFIKQAGILTLNKTYKLVFEVKSVQQTGSLRVGFASLGVANITDIGTYTIYFVANGSEFQFVRNSAINVIIDNVSVKQVDPNDYWVLGTGSTKTDTLNIISTDGSLSFGKQQNVLEVGKTYQYSFDITSYTSGTLFFIEGSTNVLSGLNATGTYSGVFTATGTDIEFKRGGVTNASFDNISIVEVLGDRPRLDYEPLNPTCPHLLLEPQSTNLLTQSNGFNNWTSSNLTLTSGQSSAITALDEAWLFTATGTTANVTLSVSSSGANTLSVFAKAGTQDGIFIRFSGSSSPRAFFNLSNGTLISETNTTSTNVEAFKDGWYRLSITGTDTVTDARIYVADSTGNFVSSGNIYVQNAQLEQQSYATSYIPTAGATGTRVGETCINAGNVDTFNSTEGVLYAEIANIANDLTNKKISISDGTTSNSVLIFYTNVDNAIQCKVIVGGSASMNYYFSISDVTSFSKLALKWKANDFAIWLDGSEVHTDTSGGSFSAGTLTTVNFDRGDGGEDFYGKVKGLATYNRALTDTELYTITSTQYSAYSGMVAALGNYTIPC